MSHQFPFVDKRGKLIESEDELTLAWYELKRQLNLTGSFEEMTTYYQIFAIAWDMARTKGE